MYDKRTYSSWANMKNRCLNPNADQWSYYGGIGVTVCERWLTFANFIADMGVRPANQTLDRIDSNGHYCPENCRWSTVTDNCRNRSGVKLTVRKAQLIRALLSSVKASVLRHKAHRLIGKAFGVSSDTIRLIDLNIRWKESAT